MFLKNNRSVQGFSRYIQKKLEEIEFQLSDTFGRFHNKFRRVLDSTKVCSEVLFKKKNCIIQKPVNCQLICFANMVSV